jgi:hypothetical protein
LTTAALTYAGKLGVAEQDAALSRQLRAAQGHPTTGPAQPGPDRDRRHASSPRQVLHALWEPQIRAAPDERDLIIIRILARGLKQGAPADAWVDLIHYADETTGFSAMEQGTGWHAAILTHAIAEGKVPAGVVPVEKAMSWADFVAQAGSAVSEVRSWTIRPGTEAARRAPVDGCSDQSIHFDCRGGRSTGTAVLLPLHCP